MPFYCFNVSWTKKHDFFCCPTFVLFAKSKAINEILSWLVMVFCWTIRFQTGTRKGVDVLYACWAPDLQFLHELRWMMIACLIISRSVVALVDFGRPVRLVRVKDPDFFIYAKLRLTLDNRTSDNHTSDNREAIARVVYPSLLNT